MQAPTGEGDERTGAAPERGEGATPPRTKVIPKKAAERRGRAEVQKDAARRYMTNSAKAPDYTGRIHTGESSPTNTGLPLHPHPRLRTTRQSREQAKKSGNNPGSR